MTATFDIGTDTFRTHHCWSNYMNDPDHNQYNGLRLLFAISCILFSGCTLADACKDNEYRQDDQCIACPEGKQVNKARNGCLDTIKSCGQANTNCLEIDNVVDGKVACVEEKCQVSECKPGYIRSDTRERCIACPEGKQVNETQERCLDTLKSCGSANTNCLEIDNVVEGKVTCNEGKCQVSECKPGYKLSDTSESCEKIPITVNQCGDNGDCITTGVEEAHCNTNAEPYKCQVTKCTDNYHISEDQAACIEDSASQCGAFNIDCYTENPNAQEMACVNKTCKVITCQKDYHNDSDTCVKDSITACGLASVNCTSIKNSTNHKCEDGTCKYDCRPETEVMPGIPNCFKCNYNKTYSISANSINYNFTETECTKKDLAFVSYCSSSANCSINSDTLEYVGGTLNFRYWAEENAVWPTTIDFNKLLFTDTLLISDTESYNGGRTEPCWTELSLKFENLIKANKIIFEYLYIYDYSDFSSLQEIGERLILNNININNLYFSNLRSIGNTSARDTFDTNYDYYTLIIENTKFVEETTSIYFYNLSKVIGSVKLYDNEGTIELPALETIDGYLDIKGNKRDKYTPAGGYDFPSLTTITGLPESIVDGKREPPLTISGVSYINMPKLKKIGDGKIIVTDSPELNPENCILGENECIIIP